MNTKVVNAADAQTSPIKQEKLGVLGVLAGEKKNLRSVR